MVTANGQTYHEDCFKCHKCCQRFEPGKKVTFDGTNYLCNGCLDDLKKSSTVPLTESSDDTTVGDELPQDGDLGRKSVDDARSSPHHAVNYGKFYQMSYLDKVSDFKRGPSLNPSGSERSPKHYHRPENFSYSSVRRDFIMPAKKGLVTDLESETLIASVKSEIFFPMRNKEPIRLARLPDAHPLEKNSDRMQWSHPPELATSYRDHVAGMFASSSVEMSESVKAERGSDAVDSLLSSSPNHERPQSSNDRCSYGERFGSQEDVFAGKKVHQGLLQSDTNAGKCVSSSCDGIDSRRHHDTAEEELRLSAEEFDPTTGLRRLKFHPFRFGTGRSVPCLFKVVEAPKVYGYDQLRNCQDHLPPGVDWMKVEWHLSKEEFEGLFHMSRGLFYQLAEWKRNDLKARVGLF